MSGSEVYYSSQLLEMDLSELVIENTDYILIEFSTQSMPSNLRGQLSEIQAMGYNPIIAHIEKYAYFREETKLIRDLIHQDILMQVNASAFLDKRQRGFISACNHNNNIHLIASDTHSTDKRPPKLGKIKETNNKEYIDLLYRSQINAQKVLNNKRPTIRKPGVVRKLFGNYY